MITKKASIEWILENQGGRRKPPVGTGNPPYATVIRFADEPWPHSAASWSLVVRKKESQSTEYRWIADVHYLMENAPHDSLRDGRKFELYEGKKCVACGQIIGDAG
jgi:hypothetical protein